MRSYSIPEKIVKMVKVMYSTVNALSLMGQVCMIGSRSKLVLNRVVTRLDFFPACCGLGYEKDHQTWEHKHQMEVQQLPRRS